VRAATAAALLLACAPPAGAPGERPAGRDEHGEHGDDGHAHAALPTRVRLSAAVVADAKIASEPATRRTIAPSFLAPGQIEADPARTYEVAARVAGVVDALEFREGDVVAEGQVLAKIRAPGLGGMRADLAALQARAVSADANLQRLEALAQRSMASQQEIAAARAEATALAAEARAARQRLGALGLRSEGATSSFLLRAPAAGFVARRGVAAGQAVLPEQNVATIVNLERAYFMARVFEHTLARVRVGAAAEVELNGYPGRHFAGAVEFLSPKVDPEARTIVARVPVDNRDDLLRVGLFGTARIAAPVDGASEPRLAVPRSALVEVAGKTCVFVEHAAGEYELHEVILGAQAPGLVEVVQGLGEGERVVVAGVWTLKSVLLKETFGEDEH
jgi:cobalt-zinc-cadmium efflux system membrane fusion protein